jgi:CMP-N,N'-diacetyllegionaminic acid synthase
MRILAIIPARSGSKGVPGKNTKFLGDKPLISYTINVAKQIKEFDEVILSTDSKGTADIGLDLGISVPFLRDSSLSKDDTPMVDVIENIIKYYDNFNKKYDAFCLMQPTVPFRKVKNVKNCLKKFTSSNDDLSLFTVRKVPSKFNPHWVFKEKNKTLSLFTNELNIVTRRQELPNTYYRDGDIYLFNYNTFKNNRSIYTERNNFVLNNYVPYVNIDNIGDWNQAEEQLKIYNNEVI